MGRLRASGLVSHVMRATYPGPQPGFSAFQVIKALLTIGSRKLIGRKLLADEIGLGPGAVRTLVQRLSAARLVASTPSGCRLTSKGLALYEELAGSIRMKPIRTGRLAVDRHSVAIRIRDAAGSVRRGLEQRDAAVRAGATGATTLIVQQGRFTIPGESLDCEEEFPDPLWRTLIRDFEPHDGDVFVVSSAPTLRVAEEGAIAASLDLLEVQSG